MKTTQLIESFKSRKSEIIAETLCIIEGAIKTNILENAGVRYSPISFNVTDFGIEGVSVDYRTIKGRIKSPKTCYFVLFSNDVKKYAEGIKLIDFADFSKAISEHIDEHIEYLQSIG